MYYTKEEYEEMLAEERKRIGSQISEARKEAGLSQEQLSEKSGLSRSDISRIENGVRNVTVDSLTMIAHALGCEVWTLRRKMSSDGKVNYDRGYVDHIFETGKALTMAEVRRLRGKRIAYTFPVDSENNSYVEEAVIGEDIIVRENPDNTRSYFITSEDGRNLYIFSDSMEDNAEFYCTDWGRVVYFVEL